MAEYKVSETANSQKVFLTKRSQLEGRIDTNYYIEKPNYSNCIRLSTLAKVKGGKRIPLGYDYSQEETSNLYLRVANMDENSNFDYSNFKYISDEVFNMLERYAVLNDDLIISIAGTVGKIKILSDIPSGKKVILTENCAKIVLNDKNNILPKYLKLVLQTKFLKNQINLSYIQTTIPKLGLDKILSLRLPLIPNIKYQLKIIDHFETAYIKKQQKEFQAKQFLDSIDDYLLNELGITLPEKDTSKKSRMFTTKFSEISGGRFDIFAILNKDYKIQGGKYTNKTLKSLANLVKGQSITSDSIIDGEYPVIAGGQSSPYNHNVYNHIGNVITVSASGAYSGFLWYHNTPIFASDCTVIQSKNEMEISTIYLFEMLKSKQQEIYHLQQGAGQPHVYARDLEKLNIPVPPLKKQIEIVNHIQDLRNQAKQLQDEAKEVLEEAKFKIEKMILG